MLSNFFKIFVHNNIAVGPYAHLLGLNNKMNYDDSYVRAT